VTRHDEEASRVLGVPRRQDRREGEEPQRALGIPVDWIADVDVAFFRSFVHPIKAYRRWDRRRRLGAYALDDEDERRGQQAGPRGGSG
jgi:hypothetical protein